MKKICVICGKEFVLKNNRAHNRRICYNEHYYKCDYCGKEFVLSEQQSQQLARGMNKKFFCSLSCSSKYGNETRDMKKVIEKMNKTCLEKYGVVGYNNRNKFAITSKQGDIWIKSHLTKKENGTYGKSIQEDIFYNYVKQNTDLNIERQVLIDSMSFDFKINNILVELNGNYFHNYKLFTNTEQDLQEYNNLKLQGGQKATIADTWRYRDTEKLNYCKENNILLLVVYFDNIEDILQSILNCLKTITNTTILRFNKNTLVEKQVLNSGNIDTVFNTTNKYYDKNIINTLQNKYENSSISLKQLSENYNIPKGTVQNWKQKYNWTKKEQYLKEYKQELGSKFEKSNINDKDVQQIKYLYENTDLSVKEIGKQLNMTVDMVRNRINKYSFKRTKEQISRIMSEKQKSRWNNYTEERQEEIKQKMSKTNKEVWANRDIDKKQEIIQHRLNTINNKSEKELQETKDKISKSVTKYFNNISKDKLNNWKKRLSYAQQHLSPEIYKQKIIKDRQTKHKNNSFRNAEANDGKHFDSNYEVIVYEFCKRNNIPLQTQIPIKFKYNEKEHITFIDFKIDNYLFECKGGHLMKGVYDYKGIPICEKLKVYKDNHIVIITDKLGSEIIPKPNSTESNGLKYLNKCPNPLIGVDIDLFKNQEIHYREDRPKCFYDVRVDGKRSVSEAWQDELLRWKMIKNRIDYVGGFIDNRQILTAMNVTRNCKQPSWFSKQYAKELIQKYITTNIILDPFAGWGTRCDACKELNIKYYGWDLNKELVDWHKEKGRLFETGCGIEYGDANNIKTDRENCSVFICPPYTDFETYFEGQDLKTTQCKWLQIVMNNIPNAKEYLMVCKVVDPGFEKYIVEEKINKSHLGVNKEYVLLIKNKI